MAQTKTAKPLPKIDPLPGAVCKQWKRCTHGNCKCMRGDLHGPYLYRMWREGGRLRKQYVKPAQADQVRQACALYRIERQVQRREQELGRMTVRQLIKQLRDLGC